jgi:hypothetical protein
VRRVNGRIARLLLAITLLGGAPALTGTAASAREAQAPSPPEIEVLDQGSEPREALRRAVAVGTPERSAMTMRFDIEQSGVSEASVKAPPIRATIAMVPQDVTPNGDLHVNFSYPSQEFRLEERDATTLELHVRGTQTARRQTVDAPSGVTLRVRSFKTTYRGSTTQDLTRLLPVSSRVRASGDQTFGVRAGDESGELRQHIEIDVTLEPE